MCKNRLVRRSSRSRAVKAMSHYIATHASSLHSQPSSSIPVATSLKHPYIRRAQTLIASPVPIPLPSFYTISTLSSKKPNAQQPNCNSRRGYHSDIENDSSECEEEEEEDDDVDCIDSLGASIENDAASDGEDSTEEVMDEHTSGNFLVEFNETSLHLQGVSNRSNPSTAPRSVLPRRASPLHLLASYKYCLVYSSFAWRMFQTNHTLFSLQRHSTRVGYVARFIVFDRKAWRPLWS